MRTNIDIDDELMAQALKAGPYKTKKDAVEAGLKLLARQTAYREILKWRGKLHWDGDDEAVAAPATTPATVPSTKHGAAKVATPALAAQEPAPTPYAAKARRGRR